MKNVLLIGGGGTLGTYVTDEMVSRGVHVDVICLEDYENSNMVTYYKEKVNFEYIQKFLNGKTYAAIVDFLHYVEIKDYEKMYNLYSEHTNQIVLLSSYRVYADEAHPIVEESPTWFDVDVDKEFLETEDYALPKLRCEKFLKSCSKKNWTIVRPVISFSDKRFDLFTYSGSTIITKIKNKEKIILPQDAKNIVAGIDWAGNTGRLIGKLLMNEKALGETFTISSGPNITWGDFADIYSEVLGADISWGSMDEFIKYGPDMRWNKWGLKYDRMLERSVDVSKVMRVTGTKKEDFKPIKEALAYEFNKIKEKGGI
jgi:nucleoside-diphosphate-sugar epimerase